MEVPTSKARDLCELEASEAYIVRSCPKKKKIEGGGEEYFFLEDFIPVKNT